MKKKKMIDVVFEADVNSSRVFRPRRAEIARIPRYRTGKKRRKKKTRQA